MAYLDTGRVRLWYDVRGEGFPVLFIHGGFAGLGYRLQPRTYEWLDEFSPHYRAVVYHRRGCGWSSLPSDGWSLADQVADALAILDALGLEQAHIIGSSAGGPIALLLALEHPQRVRSLALANTAASLFRPEADRGIIAVVRSELDTLRREGALAMFRRRPLEARVSLAALWERPAAEASGRLEEWSAEYRRLAEEAAASLREEEWAQLCAAEVENIAAYLDIDLRPRLGEVRAPAIVVHGDADRVVPLEWGIELARMLPAAELAVVPGAPHGILGDSAEARRLVLEFFLRVDGRLR
ncbi:MAG: alpha/beta hydrolase [Dehalococcoidia bacterium]|jgi:pimeloyl-ACP methyl ester carboxylesterase|nr:alpha/beta hydrolase [Dehalococcoidia bacterium]MDW8009475.1 alpha/beta hydrolase [Chloroflexota bacterium]HXG42366.1 alpha/beta hydrolase [Dehalococcoidia bacterium]